MQRKRRYACSEPVSAAREREQRYRVWGPFTRYWTVQRPAWRKRRRKHWILVCVGLQRSDDDAVDALRYVQAGVRRSTEQSGTMEVQMPADQRAAFIDHFYRLR